MSEIKITQQSPFLQQDNINDMSVYSENNISTSDNNQQTLFLQEQQKQELDRRSWTQRTFSPMAPGSVRGSIFALMAAAMGTGLLALPSNANASGIILALIMVLLGGILSLVSMYLLVKCAFQRNVISYSVLVEDTYGKVWRIILELIVIFYTWGGTIGYQIAFSEFMIDLLDQFGVSGLYKNSQSQTLTDKGNTVRIITNCVFIIPNLPITLLKNLSNLRYLTVVSMASLLYILIVIIVYFFKYLGVSHDNVQKDAIYFNFNDQILNTFSTTVFAYVCQQFVFPIRRELRFPSEKRMHKILNRAIVGEILFYSAITIFGYLTWYGQTNDLIINNYENIPMAIGKIVMMITLFFGVPLSNNPIRSTLYEISKQQPSQKLHIIISVSLQLSSALLAIVYPQVKAIFGFLGGTGGTIMAFTLPILMYIKVQGEPYYTLTNYILLFIAIVVTVAGFAGAIIAVI